MKKIDEIIVDREFWKDLSIAVEVLDLINVAIDRTQADDSISVVTEMWRQMQGHYRAMKTEFQNARLKEKTMKRDTVVC